MNNMNSYIVHECSCFVPYSAVVFVAALSASGPQCLQGGENPSALFSNQEPFCLCLLTLRKIFH